MLRWYKQDCIQYKSTLRPLLNHELRYTRISVAFLAANPYNEKRTSALQNALRLLVTCNSSIFTSRPYSITIFFNQNHCFSGRIREIMHNDKNTISVALVSAQSQHSTKMGRRMDSTADSILNEVLGDLEQLTYKFSKLRLEEL